jgi:NgoFVII restriction endonuclease
MTLFTLLTTTGLVHKAGGLNWGSNSANHTRIFDAYIPIHIGTIRLNPGFGPVKSPIQNQNIINIFWDDGTQMAGKFEGNITDIRTGSVYPKQISSFPHKDNLGVYFRARLGVIGNRPIVMADLTNYGRTHVNILYLGGNNYQFDFS